MSKGPPWEERWWNYTTGSGRKQALAELRDLPEPARAKALTSARRIAHGKPDVRDHSLTGSDLRYIKTSHDNEIYRCFYGRHGDTLVLLHVWHKKAPKKKETPARIIKRAESRWADWLDRYPEGHP